MKATMSRVAGPLLALCCLALPASTPLPRTDVDFATLSGFDYVEGMTLPKSVTKYDEQTVTITGFMQREEEGTGDVEYFMLVNDACGCQGTPKLNEIVFCAMPEGETTDIKPGVVSVTGTLYVGEEKDEDIVLSIYSLDVDSVGK